MEVTNGVFGQTTPSPNPSRRIGPTTRRGGQVPEPEKPNEGVRGLDAGEAGPAAARMDVVDGAAGASSPIDAKPAPIPKAHNEARRDVGGPNVGRMKGIARGGRDDGQR